MADYVALLRGMNLGGRRIRNEDLCQQFEDGGFLNPRAFLASGNVVFESDEGIATADLECGIEECLSTGLGYEVPTLVRAAAEIMDIAAKGPFKDERGGAGGKPQVLFLRTAPKKALRDEILDFGTSSDQLVFEGRELHWLPEGGVLETSLDIAGIQAQLGLTTMRTRRTVERLSAKYFD